MRQKRIVTWLLATLLLLAGTAVLSTPRAALGQMTIPTRTPKPETQPTSPPPEPTDDNGGGGGGNNNPNPTNPPPQETAPPEATSPPPVGATSTAVLPSPTATSFAVVPPAASATPTATAVVTVSPSPTVVLLGTPLAFPAGALPFPTAVACSRPPTFQARPGAAASVYAGPGETYEVTGLVGPGQARPIIGRAAFVSWWLVQLDRTGQSGWVMDEAGQVQGDTGRVSIVSAPDLAGAVPTPGAAPWVPTPNPACAAGAAPASEAAAAEGAVAVADAGGESQPPSSEPVIIAAVGSAGDTAVAAPTAAGGALDLIGETSARRGPGDTAAAADAIVAELAQQAEPLAAAPPPSAPNFMPWAGLGLIVAAVVLGVYLRRGGASAR